MIGYHNGIETKRGHPLNPPNTCADSTFRIGGDEWGQHFVGVIDDVAVLNVAVSGEQMQAIYNAGNNYSGNFLEMEASLFEQAWRVGTLGGFLFAREVLRRMVPRNQGTLIFTGASASLRGKPRFAPFTAAKAGLRAMSQSLAREFQPQGIHVAHVVIDGIINGDRIRNRAPALVEQLGEEGMLQLDDIASAYMFLHQQPRSAWTHELDLRTFQENF